MYPVELLRYTGIIWCTEVQYSALCFPGFGNLETLIGNHDDSATMSTEENPTPEYEHPLGRRKISEKKELKERKTISWGHVHVAAIPDSELEDVKRRNHRRHVGSFEDERALKKMTAPRSKIQMLKDMRQMRRAALRSPTPARRMLQDPKGSWILILILFTVTILAVHYCCDTWLESLLLITVISVVTVATATIQ